MSHYLTESETMEVQKIYESMKSQIEQSKQEYYLDDDRQKAEAMQRQIIGESRFKRSGKRGADAGVVGGSDQTEFPDSGID